MAVRSTPTERIAGLAFFAFTLMQVPFFVVESNLAPSGVFVMSPLQVTAASLARGLPPGARPALEAALLPGAWVREPLSRFVRCLYLSRGSLKKCVAERAALSDGRAALATVQLPRLEALLDPAPPPPQPRLAQRELVAYGCAMIVVSALFSLVYSVKTAVLGYLLLGWGLVQGDHMPLPPFVLTLFLVVYAGFQLGEARSGGGNAQRQQLVQQQQRGRRGGQQQPAGGGGGSSSGADAAAGAGAEEAAGGGGGGSAKKQQRKQARRQA